MEIRIDAAIATALARDEPVVALESTLIAHGLPRPGNRVVAERIEQITRSQDASPATVAVLDGVAHVGLATPDLVRVAEHDMIKLTERDLPIAAAKRLDGATTVAATAGLAARAGITVFATGGLGGVHRGAAETWDVSADLGTLARTPVIVVCAGVKSILDVPATLERLETLGVTVVGYRTESFPGFYRSDAGLPVPWTVDDADEIAAIHHAQRAMGAPGALVVANPLPPDRQLDPDLHDRALAGGLAAAEAAGVTGAALTPFLLAHFHDATGGRSQEVNVELVLSNARLAAQIAHAVAARAVRDGR